MSRKLRNFIPNVPFHVIQRGNNKAACFLTNEDRAFYLNRLLHYSLKFSTAVHNFVLMSNHVHLLLTPPDISSISDLMQALGTTYVRNFNHVHERSGTLWEGRFKASLIDSENYFLTVSRYIEMNPVRAGMVSHPGEYDWSSYRKNAMGYDIKLLTSHPIYLALGKDDLERRNAYQALFGSDITDLELQAIRASINKTGVLGSEDFIQSLELS